MRKLFPVFMAFAMTAAALTGCSSTPKATEAASTAVSTEEASTEATEAETTTAPETEAAEKPSVRVGSLKGPTSMGLVSMMDLDEKGETLNDYEFTMVTAADELLGKMVNGDLDIALVPANVSSVLYNKTEGAVSVIDINTLGVLYMVSGDTSIKSIVDLKGKTVYLTGKGTTPDYALQYLLSAFDLTTDDVTLEYKSEATEVAAVLKEQPDAVGLLPQPFATVATTQNEALKLVLDLNEEWIAAQGDEGTSELVTGVTIVRNEFLEAQPDAVANFMMEHTDSADFAISNTKETAELVVAAGIIEKAPIAEKALPYCNITYIEGEEMKQALSGYLEVLFQQNPASVGGALPADDFYYMPQ